MNWKESIESLLPEIGLIREERERIIADEESERETGRAQITALTSDLGIMSLLENINSTVFGNSASIEFSQSWDTDDTTAANDTNAQIPMDNEEEYGIDYVSTILSWNEQTKGDSEREIAVDIGISVNGIYLQVNEIDVRPERIAVENALIEALREEIRLII
jgi:hypothetical protein